MSTIKANAVTGATTNSNLALTGNGTDTDPGVAETYIFCAFAEFPFGGSGVAQGRAR